MVSGYAEVKKRFHRQPVPEWSRSSGGVFDAAKIVGVIGFTIGIATGNFVIVPLFAGLVGVATPKAIPAAWLGVMQVAVLGSEFGMAALVRRIVRAQAGKWELGELVD